MDYDKEKLTVWASMEYLTERLERKGVLDGDNIDDKCFQQTVNKYYDEVVRRIKFCEELLQRQNDFFVNFTLAQLYDRYDIETSAVHFYKRPTRYYTIRAIRRNRQSAEAWLLLAECYSWLSVMGPESKEAPVIRKAKEESNGVSKKPEVISHIDENYLLSETQKIKIAFVEKAIRCTQKALQIKPGDESVRNRLTHYLLKRNQEFKPEDAARIFDLRTF